MVITANDVSKAAKALHNQILRTPMVAAPCYRKIWVVTYLNLERWYTSSFKARGAYYAILQLNDNHRKRGVITMSAGNRTGYCIPC